MEKMVEKYKSYMLQNIKEVLNIEVHNVTEEVTANMLKVGVKGITHLFVVYLPFVHIVLALNASVETKRGWKAQAERVNDNYEKFLIELEKQTNKDSGLEIPKES